MKINKYSIYNALSYLIDVFEGNYLAHAKHVAYTCILIGKQLGYSNERLERLYYLSLLHDIGAGNTYGLKEHCETGQMLIKKLGYDQECERIIRFHHEFINGSGPFQQFETEIPEESFIIHMANLIDGRLKVESEATYSLKNKLIEYIHKYSEFLPVHIKQVAITCVSNGYFILDYLSNTGELSVDCHLTFLSVTYLDFEEIRLFAEVFADVIDLRNTFTADHSHGIAEKTLLVLNELGYDEGIKKEAYIAAILHDIGKIFVSNDILNKNGGLDVSERFEINKHTYYTRWLLSKVEGFENVTEWASNHHEKLDGSGYPYGIDGSELDEISRLLAIIDIYQALTEARPYRDSMPLERVWSILDEMVQHNKLDGVLTEKIKAIMS